MALPVVSVILPVHNAAEWLTDCLMSLLHQSYEGPLELSIYDDASTDNSVELIYGLRESLESRQVSLVMSGHKGKPGGGHLRSSYMDTVNRTFSALWGALGHGSVWAISPLKSQFVGFAKNQAVAQSSGNYLCFLDADDVMHDDRIADQLQAARRHPHAIIGCRFHREPPGSTERYTNWANSLTDDQLYTQVFTSFGPTIIMPTWFCHRDIFTAVGGFNEGGKGTPEDLIFFYHHLELDGSVVRVDKDLLMYRYHQHAATHSISEETIWKHRVQFLEKQVLDKWESFAIWNAGKQGRKLYRSLSSCNRCKVTMFCDVDDKKIQKKFYIYEESKDTPKPKIPIVHFTEVKPPVVICVKLNLSGNFEQNLSSLHLKEGRDFVHFN